MPLNLLSIKLDPLSADPVSPAEGEVWYNTTDGFLKIRNSGTTQVIEDLKNNLAASTNPGVSDDSTAGYAVGSKWINTTSDEAFICLDSTGAAAVWSSMTTTDAVDAQDLVIEARKGSAGTITAGNVVYISGYNVGQSVAEVELADSSVAGTMPAIGITRSSVGVSTTGDLVISGQVTGLDTSSFTAGDELYVSETAGAMTTTKPTGTASIQKIGVVLRSHASQGVIQVVGAGRVNDLPNIPQNNVWLGNGSAVPTATTRSGIDDTAIHDNVDGEINAITAKSSPVAADIVVTEDSAASFAKKKVTLGNLVAGGLSETEVSATGSITTASATFAVMTTMTITPAAGTYLCMFSTTVQHTVREQITEVAIYNNAVQIAHSLRDPGADDQNDPVHHCVHTQALTTVSGSQAIDVRWRRLSGGTSTVLERSLIILRVG